MVSGSGTGACAPCHVVSCGEDALKASSLAPEGCPQQVPVARRKVKEHNLLSQPHSLSSGMEEAQGWSPGNTSEDLTEVNHLSPMRSAHSSELENLILKTSLTFLLQITTKNVPVELLAKSPYFFVSFVLLRWELGEHLVEPLLLMR